MNTSFLPRRTILQRWLGAAVYEVITAVCIGCILGICYGALFPCQQSIHLRAVVKQYLLVKHKVFQDNADCCCGACLGPSGT